MPTTVLRRIGTSLAVVLAVVLTVAACGVGGSARPTMNTVPVNPIRPRLTPSPGPQDEAIARFVELVMAEDFSYRVAFKGGVGLSTAQLPIDGRTDVAGADFTTTFTYDFSKELKKFPDLPDHMKLSVRGVDGKGYMRRDSGSWSKIKVGAKGETSTAFWAVTAPKDITFVATDERESGTFYRILVPNAVLIHPITVPYSVRAEKVRTTSLEILIDADGRPVIGTWKASNQARVGQSGQLQGIAYELRLTFSRLGEPVEISKP